MPWWVWIPLGVFVLSALGVTVALVLLAIRGFRLLRTVGRTATGALDELASAAEELERHVAALGGRAEALERRLDRLRASLARLAVLNWALADAREALTPLRGAVPRK